MAEKKTTASVTRLETTQDVRIILFGDKEWSVPTSRKWPIDVLEAAEDGRVVTMVRGLLGEKQWTKFRGIYKEVGDLEDFMTAVGEQMDTPNR